VRLVYEPAVLVIEDNEGWRVVFDWEDAYKGIYDELGNFYSMSDSNEPLEDFEERGDDALFKFLRDRGLLDVSVY